MSNSTIIKIIYCLDKWLEQNNEKEITAMAAASILDKAGLLKDSKSRPGKPLRKKLCCGEISSAYKRGRNWFIAHSKNSIADKNIEKGSQSPSQIDCKIATSINEFDEAVLLDNANFKTVGECNVYDIPNSPGFYAIRVRDIKVLPEMFRCELENRHENLLYIGIASKNLRKRLWEEELHAKRPATFFRSIGAMLGFLPPKGSLSLNSSNYKFSPEDNNMIINWMGKSLLINFIEYNGKLDNIEKFLINKYQPIINIEHNPDPFIPLKELRKKCRDYARTPIK